MFALTACKVLFSALQLENSGSPVESLKPDTVTLYSTVNSHRQSWMLCVGLPPLCKIKHGDEICVGTAMSLQYPISHLALLRLNRCIPLLDFDNQYLGCKAKTDLKNLISFAVYLWIGEVLFSGGGR